MGSLAVKYNTQYIVGTSKDVLGKFNSLSVNSIFTLLPKRRVVFLGVCVIFPCVYLTSYNQKGLTDFELQSVVRFVFVLDMI